MLDHVLTLAAGPLSHQQITVFLLAFGVMLGTARLFGEIARRLGQPMVLGEILAGVVLGATVLGNPAVLGAEGANVRLYNWLFPVHVLDEHQQPVQVVRVQTDDAGNALVTPGSGDSAARVAVADGEAKRPNDSAPLPVDHDKTYDGGYLAMTMFLNLSAVFLLLVAGLEVDLSIVWRQGKAALWVSLAGMVLPFGLGFGLAYLMPNILGYDPQSDQQLPFALFLGIAMSITALPVIAKILMDLNMFRSDIGMLIMSSAMVNDLLGWIGFAIVLAMIAGPVVVSGGDVAGAVTGADAAFGGATSQVLTTIVLTLVFVGGMLTLGRWLIHKSLPFIQAHSSWPGGVLGFVLTIALVCAAMTEAIGIHAIFGAFIAGVAIGDSKHLRQQTHQTIEQFISNIFAPLFFAGIGLRVNFIADFHIVTVTVVLVVAIFGKLVGCYFGAIWAGLSRRESAAVGMGMSARGAMEIILGQLALSMGLITEKLFVAIVVMALTTSLIAGPAMQAILRQKQKRRLPDLISDKLFAGRIKARTRRAAIEELSVLAAQVSGLEASFIADAVWRREQLVSTGLPNSLAIPHARLPELEKPMIVIGQSEPGVDFDSADGKYAEIICMLLTPAGDGEAQLEMLAAVAEAFERDEARVAALDARNFTEFKAALMTSVSGNGH